MNLETKKINQAMLVKPLVKSIDASNTTEFKSKLVDVVNEGNYQIILDLSEVDFVDSSGLGAFIAGLKAVSHAQGNLVVCGMKSSVSNLFALTRMNRVFQICRGEEDAIKEIEQLYKSSMGQDMI